MNGLYSYLLYSFLDIWKPIWAKLWGINLAGYKRCIGNKKGVVGVKVLWLIKNNNIT